MTLSALVCYFSLETKLESYYLVGLFGLVRQNSKGTPIQVKVGKWQDTKLSGPWIRIIP